MKQKPSGLDFREVDVREGASVALLLADGSRCGIYWIDFVDGTSYVGQSVEARSRLASHRRRWDDAERVRFATCAPENLDRFELAMIQYVQEIRPLRNVLLTSWPRAEVGVIVSVSDGVSLPLPRERQQRDRLDPDDVVVPQVASPNWRKLAARPDYSEIVDILHTFIEGVIPSPTKTQRLLWTLAALPSTNRAVGWRRLFALSAGRLEVLYVYENLLGDQPSIDWYLNLDSHVVERSILKALRRRGLRDIVAERVHRPSAAGEIVVLHARGWQSLLAVLEDPEVLDACYGLIVRLLRQGINPLKHHHDLGLASEAMAGRLT
ncbi:GIY-YIG nuclease family protein [Pseudolysinimonas sp.]